MQPVLHVSAGLALNRMAQAVALPSDIDLALIPTPDAQNAEAGLFALCQPVQATVLTNPGLYVLAITPASGLSTESAPKSDVFNEAVATTCGSRWVVEGAKLRTVQLQLGTNPDPSTLAGQTAQIAGTLNPLLEQLFVASGGVVDSLKAQIAPLMSRLRNCAAHLCFGTEQFAGLAANPFGRVDGNSLFADYGALDQLRDLANLNDCDVPLALLYWTTTGLQFIDMWSVRRPVFPQAVSGPWAPLSGKRRAMEGLAMFLQFQCQVSGLLKSLTNTALGTVKAPDYFRYLPAAGLLPLAGTLPSGGFDYVQFFSTKTHRNPVYMEGAKLEALLHRSLLYPPVDLSNGEMIWLYWLRENMETIVEQSVNRPQGYLLFTNGQMLFQGEARFDLNYWNYANYV